MLDHVLALAAHARARPATNEVSIFEHAQIGLRLDQLVDRPSPKDAPDHRRRLERRLLCRAEEVDPRSEDGVNRVRHGELARKLVQEPVAVLADEDAAIDEHAEQLFDEEGIAFGTLDNKLAQLTGQAAGEHLVEHPVRILRGEGVELEQLTAGACAPAWPALKKFRSRGRDHEQRPFGAVEHVLEQLEELRLGPVDVLDEHDRGLVGDDLGQELGPGILEAIADGERV